MDDRRIKRKNHDEDSNIEKNEDMNMYSNFMPKVEKEEEHHKNEGNETKTEENSKHNDISHIDKETHEYKEKEYKYGSLEENTVVTKASKISRLLLFGFYAIFIVIGAVAFMMLRADRYEFYLKRDEITICKGCTYQVELQPKNERYFDYLKYDYSIGDKSVATVNEFGKITAVGNGTTTLKISLSPGFTSKIMTIHSEDIDIQKIDLKLYQEGKVLVGDTLDLKPNQSVTLKAVINDRNDMSTNVEYSSSNTNVATVDQFGNINTKGEGTAVIYGEKDGVTGVMTIRVKKDSSGGSGSSSHSKPTKKEIQSIAFAGSSTNITLKNGYKAQLSLVVTPKELSNSSFTWSSDNESAVVVDSKGVVTGVGNGNAKITAKSSNGKVATANVTITDQEIGISSIKISATKASVYVNGTYQLTAKLEPTTATIRDVNWKSDNEGVATVNQNGVVTGKSAGKAVITIATADGKVNASCTITVNAPTPTPKPTATPKPENPTATPKPTTPTQQANVTKVIMNMNQIELEVGQKYTLSTRVEPSSITNYKTSWISSNSNVATVDSNGVVTAKGPTTAVIIADVNGIKGTTTVVVNNKPTVTPKPTTPPTTKPTTVPTQAPSNTPVPESTFNKNYIKVSTQSVTVKAGGTTTVEVQMNNAAGLFAIKSSNTGIATVDKETLWLDGVDEDTGKAYWAKKTFTISGVKKGTTTIVLTPDSTAGIGTYDEPSKDLTGKHVINVTVN